MSRNPFLPSEEEFPDPDRSIREELEEQTREDGHENPYPPLLWSPYYDTDDGASPYGDEGFEAF